MPGMKEIGIS